MSALLAPLVWFLLTVLGHSPTGPAPTAHGLTVPPAPSAPATVGKPRPAVPGPGSRRGAGTDARAAVTPSKVGLPSAPAGVQSVTVAAPTPNGPELQGPMMCTDPVDCPPGR